MKLYEYEGKQLFRKYGIPVPPGMVASSVEEAVTAAQNLGLPVVLKAQVLVGGRGKAGGIVKAETLDEVEAKASRLLGSEIRGVPVNKLLVEKAVNIEKELYLSITMDRVSARPIILASAMGGVDIEEIAREHPEAIVKRPIDPLVGLKSYEPRIIAYKLGISKDHFSTFARLLQGLYKLFVDYDAELAEINPLAITDQGLLALDSKVIVDDNSLYRHGELLTGETRAERGEMTEYEEKAAELGLAYVELDGNIGIIGNGAGLTMATMDMVSYYGGRPADFLDLGGAASHERVYKATKFLMEHPGVDVLFINIFGGITRCDEVAKGIVEAVKEVGLKKPMVVKLVGTNEEIGWKILEEVGIKVFKDMEAAAQLAVKLASGKEG